jgi:hypothetical protein
MQPNRALIREFDGVLHQVDENLSDPLSINKQSLWDALVDRKLYPEALLRTRFFEDV